MQRQLWPFSMSDSGSGTRLTRTFNAPAADAGFVFDIYELDNSFNMTINGVDRQLRKFSFSQV